MYDIQHCFICRPSESSVSEDAWIEPRTVATTALAVALTTRIDLIQTRLDRIHTRLDLIYTRLDLIHTRLDLIHTRIVLIHSRLDFIQFFLVFSGHVSQTKDLGDWGVLRWEWRCFWMSTSSASMVSSSLYRRQDDTQSRVLFPDLKVPMTM